MIQTLVDITAVIGFVILCVFAFLGAKVLFTAWKFAAEVAILEHKFRKLRNAKTDEQATAIVDKIQKDSDV